MQRNKFMSSQMFIRNKKNESTCYSNLKKIVVLLIVWQFGFFSFQTLAQPLASGQSKFLGGATSSYYWRYFDQYWNQLSPGNDGKWGSVSPSIKDTYNWTNLDKVYNYAKGRNLIFKEHALVWGQQAPSWIASLDSSAQRASVENWMKLFGERYPLTAMADVVNEPFHEVPSYAKGLGGNGKTGWDWVITAFELARKYMPAGCKLILNEYNVLHDNTVTANYLNLIKLLNDRKLIDGIGIQGHYFEFRSHIDATSGNYVWNVNTIKSNLDKLAATDLPIYITEFDVDEKDDANQLASYKIYFPIFWTHPAVKGITLWGYISNDVWSSHPTTYLIIDDGSYGVERPALQWLRNYISTTDVKEENEIPSEFVLDQNYPNPFNPETTINYTIPNVKTTRRVVFTTLKVYDALGREVATLVNEVNASGNYSLKFNGGNLPSGVYFCRLSTNNFSKTIKLSLVK